MLLEFLVSSVCLQNYDYGHGEGCPSALQAYYLSHGEIREFIRRGEKKIRSYPYADSTITYVLIPAYTGMVARKFTVPVTNRFSVIVNMRQQASLLEYSIPF